MSPWIESSRPLAGVRWLDESAVALRGQRILEARSMVSGALHRDQGPPLQPVFGQTSVQGVLTLRQVVVAASSGVATVAANLGWLRLAEGSSSGSSQVSGELLVGIAQFAAAVSPDARSTVAAANLAVKRYSNISGSQSGEDWSANEPSIPVGRDHGPTRGRFTPHSVGLTNERETWRR